MGNKGKVSEVLKKGEGMIKKGWTILRIGGRDVGLNCSNKEIERRIDESAENNAEATRIVFLKTKEATETSTDDADPKGDAASKKKNYEKTFDRSNEDFEKFQKFRDFIGIKWDKVENKVYDIKADSLAEKLNVKLGWVIVKIGKKDVSGGGSAIKDELKQCYDDKDKEDKENKITIHFQADLDDAGLKLSPYVLDNVPRCGWSSEQVKQWMERDPQLYIYATTFECWQVNGIELAQLDDKVLSDTYKVDKKSHRHRLLEVVEMVQDELSMQKGTDKVESEEYCIINGAHRYFFEAEFEVVEKKKQPSMKVKLRVEEQKNRLIKRVIKQIGLAVTESFQQREGNEILGNQGNRDAHGDEIRSKHNYQQYINVSASPFEMWYRPNVSVDQFVKAVNASGIDKLTIKRWTENFNYNLDELNEKWKESKQTYEEEEKKEKEKEAGSTTRGGDDAEKEKDADGTNKDKTKKDKGKDDDSESDIDEEEEKDFWCKKHENGPALDNQDGRLKLIYEQLKKRTRIKKNDEDKINDEGNNNGAANNEGTEDADKTQTETKHEPQEINMKLGPCVQKTHFYYGNTIFIDLTPEAVTDKLVVYVCQVLLQLKLKIKSCGEFLHFGQEIKQEEKDMVKNEVGVVATYTAEKAKKVFNMNGAQINRLWIEAKRNKEVYNLNQLRKKEEKKKDSLFEAIHYCRVRLLKKEKKIELKKGDLENTCFR